MQRIPLAYFLYFIVFSVGILLFFPIFFTRPIFLDGVTYATIARNLSQGIGSFWSPQYTTLRNEPFYIQPPLAFGLNSILFKMFGDHDWVEKVYSLATLAISNFLVVNIWKSVSNQPKLGAFPLLIWMTTPLVFWSFRNNMLENTVTVFTLACLFFQLKSMQTISFSRQMIALYLAATCLIAAFLTKGLVATFPLMTLPLYAVCFALAKPDKSFSIAPILRKYGFFLFFLILQLTLLFLSQSDSLMCVKRYFGEVSKMLNEKTVSSHFYSLNRLTQELFPVFIILIISYLFARKKQITLSFSPIIAFFILTGLSASLPIMISLRQSHYYIMPSLIYFAIALCLYISPLLEKLGNVLEGKYKNYLALLGLFLLIIGIAQPFVTKHQPNETEICLSDAQKIASYCPHHQILKACYQLETDYKMRAYLYRYFYITLDTDIYKGQPQLILLPKNDGCAYIDRVVFEEIQLGLRNYQLLKMKPNAYQ